MTILNYGITNSMILLSQEPLSERMKMATLNTVLGLGIVFVVLTLIILVISLLKYLPGVRVKEDYAKKDQDDKTTLVENTVEENPAYEEADLMDDHELVAVIAAAISAFSSEVNPDDLAGGFVVRSIRRINNRRMS